MLRLLDRTLPSPEENLAIDERLVEVGCETIRFWESPVPFVVMGRSGKAEEEVDLAACEAAGIPVLRRSSGGGTVLQGPGCLSYALALSLELRPQLANVEESYRMILGRIAEGLRIPGVEVRGSDILHGGKKVSGNAQRRTKGWLLHHGTLLYEPDIGLMERVLLEPRRQPLHRARRRHREFVAALPLCAAELRDRTATSWVQPVQAASSFFAGTNPAASISFEL